MKTNIGLVEYARKALAERWGYVWGTFGLILTDTLFQQKLKQHPLEVGRYEAFIRQNWLGRKTTDCAGLIKSYMWEENGRIPYKAKTDVSANGMYNVAREKGAINTMPDIPGICVWRQGHIGVYIGNRQVIEAKGTKYGVVQTPLRGLGSNNWTHWLKVPYIEYLDWKEIIKKTTSNPEQWEKAINTAVNVAKADGDLGELEIFKYLPDLIEKIYRG